MRLPAVDLCEPSKALGLEHLRRALEAGELGLEPLFRQAVEVFVAEGLEGRHQPVRRPSWTEHTFEDRGRARSRQ